ncbi:hypothetical protein BSL78_05140 [Apostichopus japonicus]|uniref:Uncharacterized protein n=1 Tax=Stichopus japonicus TaxID=307972 RepID=A0A2G8LCG2_STIJA|nr:hypothetical protein BSL78_05140 [Apostichopus japonicus]
MYTNTTLTVVTLSPNVSILGCQGISDVLGVNLTITGIAGGAPFQALTIEMLDIKSQRDTDQGAVTERGIGTVQTLVEVTERAGTTMITGEMPTIETNLGVTPEARGDVTTAKEVGNTHTAQLHRIESVMFIMCLGSNVFEQVE